VSLAVERCRRDFLRQALMFTVSGHRIDTRVVRYVLRMGTIMLSRAGEFVTVVSER